MQLQDFFKILRLHQQNAILKMDGETKGQILLPTGVGKTYVQIYKILETLQSSESAISLMTAHRLLLCEQLIKELLKFSCDFNLYGKFDVLSIGSDGIDNDDFIKIKDDVKELTKECNITNTTTKEEILKAVHKAKKLKRHLLIVSTYQSVGRLEGIPIDIACLDEAHTITEESKFDSIDLIQPNIKKCFFFTATQVCGCNGRGMENEDFFGKILHFVTPKEAIETGDILPPVFHKVMLDEGKPTILTAIQAAFKAHREKVLQFSSEKLYPKLLVSSDGVDKMNDLIQTDSFQKWTLENGIHIISFSSKGYFINNSGSVHGLLEVSRSEALDKLHSLTDSDSAIIFHYDILTEGIDLPNLTGVLPLRELNKVKFKQTLGRPARLHTIDRAKLYAIPCKVRKTTIDSDNKIHPSSDLIKPVFWVIQTPLLNEQAIDSNEKMVDIIRNTYELDPEFRAVKDTSTSMSLEEAESVLPRERMSINEKLLATYNHEYEELVLERSLNENPKEQIEQLIELLKTTEEPINFEEEDFESLIPPFVAVEEESNDISNIENNQKGIEIEQATTYKSETETLMLEPTTTRTQECVKSNGGLRTKKLYELLGI